MNLYAANSLCRWWMAHYSKKKEAEYNERFPDADFRFPTPTFWLPDIRACVSFIEKLYGGFLDGSADGEPTDEYFVGLLEKAEKIAIRWGMSENWERKYVNGGSTVDNRVVVASACRYGDLITAVGARHFSPAMVKQLDAIREEKLIDLDNKGKAEQGFIDQWDVFMTREEAWEVAIRSGQLNLRRYVGHNPGKLFSEDVW